MSRSTTLLKSPNRLKSEVVTEGGLDSGTGAAAFNGSYVGAVKSGAISHQTVVQYRDAIQTLGRPE